ncbi:RNA pol II accessory factor, Cdc73 family-domain-containing protein [Podospora aff. communis PSN243]|uniref:RNA pol II accessory factor, Cdc73 family-domain-containing protein n=1 Tax=Podospora aff. communis PSN243 TaxID=3040156 RepID=A0AAV9GPW9_9PEZI|nr:RNA pol II accessory factor, Cdc73 family-domain-containing protein [Podospora aff. communis PSN243]
MANAEADPLLLLRQSIASGGAIIPTTTADPSPNAPEVPLAQATHLHFTHPQRVAIPIDAPTRFVSNDRPVDLRSIYFAWLNREIAIPDYNASATKLNDELAGTAAVHKFAFVERLDLITWLEGASEESEYIKPLSGEKDGAPASAAAVAATSKTVLVSSSARAGRGTLDPRLAQIYSGERRMGDRNTALRGIKPTDFSHVRKLSQPFMSRKPTSSTNNGSSIPAGVAIPSHQKPARRPDPIILLSPSASSLLRMSNVKAFLEGGRYTPPDHNSTTSMLHLSRIMKDIDPNRPMRFILVEGPEQFKPEYWNRVVAVFTTGQAWQFKNYRWSNPGDLFKHVLGVYLGWRGEQPPESIKSYGHRVLACSIEGWRDPGAPGAESSRWRDREVVEQIWKAIETNMRAKGWRKDAAPTSI